MKDTHNFRKLTQFYDLLSVPNRRWLAERWVCTPLTKPTHLNLGLNFTACWNIVYWESTCQISSTLVRSWLCWSVRRMLGSTVGVDGDRPNLKLNAKCYFSQSIHVISTKQFCGTLEYISKHEKNIEYTFKQFCIINFKDCVPWTEKRHNIRKKSNKL